MKDSREIVIVRTHVINDRVSEICSQLGRSKGWRNVYVVLDMMGDDIEDDSCSSECIPNEILPITRRTLDRLDLSYEGKRTGWKCGDYVLYRALSAKWDHAWVVEPDVQFLNGAESIVEDGSVSKDVDLACLNYKEVNFGWFWGRPFSTWSPGMQVASMAFPICRVSRDLAESALRLRQQYYNSNTTQSVEHPNDESVIASTALNGGYRVQDLREQRSKWFDYFSTVVKYHGPSIGARRFDPLIVHSAIGESDMRAFVMGELRKVLQGDRTATARLKLATSRLSPELKDLVLSDVLEESCRLSRKRRGLDDNNGVAPGSLD